MDSAAGGIAALGGIFMIFSVILAILWILVPFAIFGIKPLLRDLIAEQRKTYAALATISQQIHTASLLVAPAATATPAQIAVPDSGDRTEPTFGDMIREARRPD